MDTLSHIAAFLPSADRLLNLIGDVTGVALSLALAYLAYGVAHNLAHLLARKKHRMWKALHRACRIAVDILLYVIAGLYGLEYVLMRSTGVM